MCACPYVDVLCGCGWGRLGIHECDIPEFCPRCRNPIPNADLVPPCAG